MNPADLIAKLHDTPDTIQFSEVMDCIAEHYEYTPTAFDNGSAHNAAGTNEGSCRLFAFAQLHGLKEAQTLALFGDYYRVDVLQNPDAEDHANIRNFMQTGWAGVSFAGTALVAR